MTPVPEHGDVWWCEVPDIGRRPVVVLSRTAAIRARGRAIIAPCTTRVRNLASEVRLEPGVDPVPLPCVVTLDAIESASVGVFVERLGQLSFVRMSELCTALDIATDCGVAS